MSADSPAPTEELSRPLDLDRVPQAGVQQAIIADSGERSALAKRFGLLELKDLKATVDVRRLACGDWLVDGRLRAEVVQECVVTLDPLPQTVSEAFKLRFSRRAAPDRIEEGEELLSADADSPEPLEGDGIDLGAVVAEQLALALDPYPRKPGVKLEDVMARIGRPQKGVPAAVERRSPFAKLEVLRRPQDRKR